MQNIIVCDGNQAEREQLLSYARRWCDGQYHGCTVQGCADWPELASLLKQSEPDVVVIAQDGVEGLDTITSAHLPPRRVVWFSDLEFGIQAYRLCVSWFGKKPVTHEKMEQALSRCAEYASGG